MKKEKIKIERYVYGEEGNEIYIYALPHELEGFTNFYIQRKGGFFIIFIEGIKTDELNVSLERIISRNIHNWFEDYVNYEAINEKLFEIVQDAEDRIEYD